METTRTDNLDGGYIYQNVKGNKHREDGPAEKVSILDTAGIPNGKYRFGYFLDGIKLSWTIGESEYPSPAWYDDCVTKWKKSPILLKLYINQDKDFDAAMKCFDTDKSMFALTYGDR